jgi:hypothetical protein
MRSARTRCGEWLLGRTMNGSQQRILFARLGAEFATQIDRPSQRRMIERSRNFSKILVRLDLERNCLWICEGCEVGCARVHSRPRSRPAPGALNFRGFAADARADRTPNVPILGGVVWIRPAPRR